MIFGIDAMKTMENRNQHGYSNYCREDVRFGSSNIAEAMQEDPIWKEPIEVKQAVQDRFPPIGKTAARLRERSE